MADKDKQKSKGKDAPKDKKKKKGKDGAKPSGGASVANHPRAAAAVRRAKGAGGLASFVLAAWLSHRAGLSTSQVVERALAAGIAGYLLAWACAVTVWRQIVLAELRTAVELRRGMGRGGPGRGPLQVPRATPDAVPSDDSAQANPTTADPAPAR